MPSPVNPRAVAAAAAAPPAAALSATRTDLPPIRTSASATGVSRAASMTPGGAGREEGRGGGAPGGRHSFLQRRSTIGSRGTPLEYDSEERAFHSSDMPKLAAVARQSVRSAAQLARAATDWNSSVHVDQRRWERSSATLLAFDPKEYSYNYRSEMLPPSRTVERDEFGRSTRLLVSGTDHFKRVAEMPVHPDLFDKPRWDDTTAIDKAAVRQDVERLTAVSREMTRRSTTRLLAHRPHLTPMQREEKFMEDLRQVRAAVMEYKTASEERKREEAKKIIGGFKNSSLLTAAGKLLKSSAALDWPDDLQFSHASLEEEAGDAADVMHLSASASAGALHTATHTASHVSVPIGRPGKPAASGRIVHRHVHEGVYGPIPGEAAGSLAWSCCGRTHHDAKGCAVKATRLDKYCFDSM